MTIKEYYEKKNELQKQLTELTDQFIENHPYKHLEGRVVYLTEWAAKKKVVFVGVGRNPYSSVDIKYRKIKKNGEPYEAIFSARLDSTIEVVENE